ncbi:MAG: hypothetical protein GY951_01105, partial [Psychromonas sp.]|nr:hypothetical protein [Psychromonas sp.]
MGQEINKSQFTQQDHDLFRLRLIDNLQSFKQLLADPNFGLGATSFGAELELYIIDQHGQPNPINKTLYQQLNDPQLSLELTNVNLEYNFSPIEQQASPFKQLSLQMQKALNKLDKVATINSARILPIGILPTLQLQHLGAETITDEARYQLLAKILHDKRGEDFHLHIKGQESLDLHWQDVSPEGANSSFQFHYRVTPQAFANAYNAAQLITPLLIAIGANSPLFLGKQLWHETRIALFKQATDYRVKQALAKHLPSRVMFGSGWVRESIYELFAEGVYLFEPILPLCTKNSDDSNSLDELRLHQGSIWTWNRPIYDPIDGGHLRIELRSLPAGPSIKNMVANAALASGLIKGLESKISTLLPAIPFYFAEQNFYQAAKHGLNAKLFWPSKQCGTLVEHSVVDIIRNLLPTAIEGLQLLGIDEREITEQLSVIKGGLDSQMNGATWQLNRFNQYLKNQNRESALMAMVEDYYKEYKTGK